MCFARFACRQDKHGQHGADRAGNARVAKASGAHSKRPRDRPLDESDGGDQEAVGSRDVSYTCERVVSMGNGNGALERFFFSLQMKRVVLFDGHTP